jgi:hypothetical protein
MLENRKAQCFVKIQKQFMTFENQKIFLIDFIIKFL